MLWLKQVVWHSVWFVANYESFTRVLVLVLTLSSCNNLGQNIISEQHLHDL